MSFQRILFDAAFSCSRSRSIPISLLSHDIVGFVFQPTLSQQLISHSTPFPRLFLSRFTILSLPRPGSRLLGFRNELQATLCDADFDNDDDWTTFLSLYRHKLTDLLRVITITSPPTASPCPTLIYPGMAHVRLFLN